MKKAMPRNKTVGQWNNIFKKRVLFIANQ